MDDYKIIDLNKIIGIFIEISKEENHINKLEFFCKKHNILCCLACICKIKEEGYGQHFDCDVCHIKNIKNEKRNKLKENINNLEILYNQIEHSIKKIKRNI